MTTVARREQRGVALHEWDDNFARLVKATVLKPKNREATNAELALLAEQAVRTGLDPMARQIYGIYRWDSRANAEVMTIQVGIDGLRSIAERTGRYAGGPAHRYCGTDKQWTDVWSETDVPVAAKAVVRKVVDGAIVETEAVALWREYVPMGRNGKPQGLWTDKPAVMLGKCAEALALRKAFPQDLSGLYTDDEMARADTGTTASAPPPVAATPAQVPAPTVAAVPADQEPDPKTLRELPNALASVQNAFNAYVEHHLDPALLELKLLQLGAVIDDDTPLADVLPTLTYEQGGDLHEWLTSEAARADNDADTQEPGDAQD